MEAASVDDKPQERQRMNASEIGLDLVLRQTTDTDGSYRSSGGSRDAETTRGAAWEQTGL
jgi:hypothetical protein